MFIVYQIVDPSSTEVIYLGRTKDIEAREKSHNYACKTPKNKAYNKDLYVWWRIHQPSVKIVLEPIFVAKTLLESKQYEAYMILDFKFRQQKKLLNKIPRIRD